MISKSEKKKLYDEYTGIFSKMTLGILLEINKVTVSEVTELRKKLSAENSHYKVLKNRVAMNAAKGTVFEKLSEKLKQMRAIVYTFDDGLKTAKVLTQEIKKNDTMKLVSGVFISGERSQILDKNLIVEMGNLPGREELIGKLLYVLNAPVTNFVRTLNEVPASFVRGLNAVAENKQAS